MTVRKKLIRSSQVGSLFDEPVESAHKILQACVPATMSFWIDHNSTIHAVSPEHVPPGVESLIVGTYSIGGTSLAHIQDDLLAERRERAKAWID
jgi:hypothetical protein